MTRIRQVRLGNVISIDDEQIENHLDRLVRGTVEETLNTLLEPAEADRLCNAQRYERSEAQRATGALAITSATCRPRLARFGYEKVPKSAPADVPRRASAPALSAARDSG